ncbi:hypothetical protein ACIQNG_26230 [Streptomyces sp. NPDC091377]|uniref:hypothetical protein n=1 Tax=Streptomyces sp. NPDC091377 TaxID=3365995 RepID=UPI00382A35ED
MRIPHPADFYVRNFIATDPNSPTVPRTDFAKGKAIPLQWEGNGTHYRITTPTSSINAAQPHSAPPEP